MGRDDKEAPFRYDPWKPDVLQAQKTAREWRGSLLRSPLFRFISNGCAILSEDHRQELFQEIECNMKVVQSAAEYFHEDELDKLRNLKRSMQIAGITSAKESDKGIEKGEGRKGLDIELIY